jgi:hypothetical protein
MTVTIDTIAGDDVVNFAEQSQGLTISGSVSGLHEGSPGIVNVTILDSSGTTIRFGAPVSDDGTWSAVFGAPADGTYMVSADTVDDDVPTPTTRTITIDTTPPVVTSFTLSDTLLWPGDTAVATLQFSEPVILTPANFHTNFGAVSNLTLADVATNTYTGIFTPFTNVESRSGRLTLDAAWTDLAGNPSFQPSTFVPYVVDTKPPTPGTASFVGLDDTGTHQTPIVTADNTFDVALSGDVDGVSPWTIDVQRSVNGGPFQSLDSVHQSLLPDGNYRYRFVVTDAPGNSSTSNVIEVTIDTVAPAVGTLAFAHLTDSGSTDAAPVTTDNAFDLALSGTDAGAAVTYQISSDGGATWSATSSNQSGLADGTYQFRAVAADPADQAGNVSISNALAVTIDHAAVPGTLAFANLVDTGSSEAPAVTTDSAFDLALSGAEPGNVVYQVSTDHGANWSTTDASQSGLADASYLFRALLTDRAGNNATTNTVAVTIDHRAPAAGTLAFANLANGGDKGVTTDNSFDLALSGEEPGASIFYQVSTDGGASWLTTAASQSALPDGSYHYRAFITDAAGNIASTNGLMITVNQIIAGNPPVNEAPVNTVPGVQSIEANHSLTLTGFSIADGDAGSGSMRVQLKAGHGLFTADAVGGATVSGNHSSTLNLTGTLDQINAALASGHIVYTPRNDFFGDDTITMTTFDNGNSGAGGPLTDTDAVTVHVNTLVAGTAGNDSFTALAGAERIDAGAGIDTVTFGFKLIDAEIGVQSDGLVTIDGPNGSRTVLTGVEIYQFADGSVNVADGDPLVDDLYYYAHNHDVWIAHADADQHYHGVGWREGRDPNLMFDTSLYLNVNADVKAAGVDPLTQYDTIGWKQGRDTSIFFDTDAYLAANPDVKAAGIDPLRHFLTFGESEGRNAPEPVSVATPNGFDYVYFDNHNADVYRAGLGGGIDAFMHYETIGWREGRNPNAYFNTAGYLAHYADVAAAGVNPLDQYHQTGWQEGRDPSPNFDTKAYLAAYPDVAAAHIDPLAHFLQHGMAEGRHAFMVGP